MSQRSESDSVIAGLEGIPFSASDAPFPARSGTLSREADGEACESTAAAAVTREEDWWWGMSSVHGRVEIAADGDGSRRKRVLPPWSGAVCDMCEAVRSVRLLSCAVHHYVPPPFPLPSGACSPSSSRRSCSAVMIEKDLAKEARDAPDAENSDKRAQALRESRKHAATAAQADARADSARSVGSTAAGAGTLVPSPESSPVASSHHHRLPAYVCSSGAPTEQTGGRGGGRGGQEERIREGARGGEGGREGTASAGSTLEEKPDCLARRASLHEGLLRHSSRSSIYRSSTLTQHPSDASDGIPAVHKPTPFFSLGLVSGSAVLVQEEGVKARRHRGDQGPDGAGSSSASLPAVRDSGHGRSYSGGASSPPSAVMVPALQQQRQTADSTAQQPLQQQNDNQLQKSGHCDTDSIHTKCPRQPSERQQDEPRQRGQSALPSRSVGGLVGEGVEQGQAGVSAAVEQAETVSFIFPRHLQKVCSTRERSPTREWDRVAGGKSASSGIGREVAAAGESAVAAVSTGEAGAVRARDDAPPIRLQSRAAFRGRSDAAATTAAGADGGSMAAARREGGESAATGANSAAAEEQEPGSGSRSECQKGDETGAAADGGDGGGGGNEGLLRGRSRSRAVRDGKAELREKRRRLFSLHRRRTRVYEAEEDEEKDNGAATEAEAEEGSPAKGGPRRTFEAGERTAAEEGNGNSKMRLTFAPCPDDLRTQEAGGVEVDVSGGVSEAAGGQGPADAGDITSHAGGGVAARERGGGRNRRRHLAVATEQPAVAAGGKEGEGRAEKRGQRNILVRSPRSLFISSVRSPRENPLSPPVRRRRRENSSYNDEGKRTGSSTSQQEHEDVLPDADAEKKSARPLAEEEARVAAVNAASCGSATAAADPGHTETKRSAAAPGRLPRGSLVQQRVLRFASNEEAAVLRHKFEELAAAKEKEKTRHRAARRRRRAVRAAAAADPEEGIRGQKGTALSLSAEGKAGGGDAGNNGGERAPEGEEDGEDDSAPAADSVRRSLRGGGGSFYGSTIDKDSTSSLSGEDVSDEDDGEASHSSGKDDDERAMKETRIRRKTVFFEDVLREIERKATAAAEAYAREGRSRSAERVAAQRSSLLRRSLSDASLPCVAGESDNPLLTGGAVGAARLSSTEEGALKNQLPCRQSPAAAAADLYSRRSTVGRVRERLMPRPAEVYEEAWKQKGAAAHGRFLQGLETTGWMRRLTERESSTYGERSLPRSRTTWAVGVGQRRGHMQVRRGMRIKGKAKKQWWQQQQELRRPGRPTTTAATLQTSTTLQQQQQEQADEKVGGRGGDAVAVEGRTGAETKEGGGDEREQSEQETFFFSGEEEDRFAYVAMAKAREALAQQRKTKKYTTEKMGRSMALPPPPRAVAKKMMKEAAGAAAQPRKKKEQRGHQIYPDPPKKTFSRYFIDLALSSTRSLAWWHWGAGQRWPLPVESQPLRPEDMWESSTLDENSPDELEELFTSADAPPTAGRAAAEGGGGAVGGKTAAARGREVAGLGEAPEEPAAAVAEQHKSSGVSPVRTLLESRAYRAFSGFFDKEIKRQKGEKLPPQTDTPKNGSTEIVKSEKEEGQEHLQQAGETEVVEKENAAEESGGVTLSCVTSNGDGGLSSLDTGEQRKEDFEEAEGGGTRGKEEEQGSSAVPELEGREPSGGAALLAAAAVGVSVCATAGGKAASSESSATPAAGGGCTAAEESERRDEKSTVHLAAHFAAKAGEGGTHREVVAPPPAAAAGAAAQVEDRSADAVPKDYSGSSSSVAVWQKSSSSPPRQVSALLKSGFSFALPFSSVGRGDKLTATRTVSPVSRPPTPTARTTTTTAFSNTTGTTACTTSRSSWRLRLLSSGREAHRPHQKQLHKRHQQQEKREGSRYRHLQHGSCVPEVPSSCPVARALLDNLLLAQRNLVAAQTEATQLTHAKMKRLLARQRLLQRRRMLTAEAASAAQWMILREKDERREMTEEDFDAPLSRPARQQLLLHAFVELVGTQIRLEGGEDGAGTQMDSAAAASVAGNEQALVNLWATAEDERFRNVRLRATTTEEPAERTSQLLVKSRSVDSLGGKSAAPSAVGFEGRDNGEQAEGEVETRLETDAAAGTGTAAVGTEKATAAREGAAANRNGISVAEIGKAAGADEAADSEAESSTVMTTTVAHPPAEEDEAAAAEGKEGAAAADAGSASAPGDGSLQRVAAGVKDRMRTLQLGNRGCHLRATEIWPARPGAYRSPWRRHRSRRSSRGTEGDNSSRVRQQLRAHRNLIMDVSHMISNLFPPRFRAKREEGENQEVEHEEEQQQQQQRRHPLGGRRGFTWGKSKQREALGASASPGSLEEEVTAEERAAAEGELLLRQRRQEQRRAQKLMRREFRRFIRMGGNTFNWPDSEQQQEGIDTGGPGTSGDGATEVASDGLAQPAGAAAAEVGVTAAASATENGATSGAKQQQEEEKEEEQRGADESCVLREASGNLLGGALHAAADRGAAARGSRKSTGGNSTEGPLLLEAFDNVFGLCASPELPKVEKAQRAAVTVRAATAGGHEEPRIQPEAGAVRRQQQQNEINAVGPVAAEAGQEEEGEGKEREEEGDGEMAARVEEAIKGANRELARLLFEQRMLLRKAACAAQRQKQEEKQQLKGQQLMKLTRDSDTSPGDGGATPRQQQESERTKHNTEEALGSTKAEVSYLEPSGDATTSGRHAAATASAVASARVSSAGSAPGGPGVARSSAREVVAAAAVCSSYKMTVGGAPVARLAVAGGEEDMLQQQQVLVEDAVEGVSPAPSTRTWKDAWVELKRRGYAVLRGRTAPEEDEAAVEETRQESVADDEWVYPPAMEHQPLVMLQDCNFRFAQRWLEEKKKRQQNRDSLLSFLKQNFILSQKARKKRQEQWYKDFSFVCSPYPKPIDLPPRFFFTGRPAAEVIFVTSTLSVRKQTFFKCKRLSNFLACRGIVYYQIDANVDSSAGWEIYFGYCGACGSRRGADDPFCPCCHLSIRDMAVAKVLGLGIYRSSVCPQCGKQGLLSVNRQSFANYRDNEASYAVSRRSSAAAEGAACPGSIHGRGSSNSSSKLVIAEEDSAAHPQQKQQGETAWQPQRQPSVVVAPKEGERQGEGGKGGDHSVDEGDNEEEQTTCKGRRENAEGKSHEAVSHCTRTAAAETHAEEENTRQHQEYAVAGDAKDYFVPRDSSVRQCLSTVWEPSVVDDGNSM